mgnify:CR=1 FL=1
MLTGANATSGFLPGTATRWARGLAGDEQQVRLTSPSQ